MTLQTNPLQPANINHLEMVEDDQYAYIKLPDGSVKVKYSKLQKNTLDELYKRKTERHEEKKKSILFWIFDINKKFLDILDDLWNALKGFMPKNYKDLVPTIMGSVGAVVHAITAWDAGKLLIRAAKDKAIPHRKTKMTTAGFSLIFCLAGVGVSITLLLYGLKLGLTILGSVALQPLIPGLMCVTYIMILSRKIYSLKLAKEAETIYQHLYEYEACKQNRNVQVVERARTQYLFFRDQRIKAERRTAYASLELIASIVVVTGTLIAVSIASFGTVALAITIAGVAIGLSAKLFEFLDEKFHFKLSNPIKHLFRKDPPFVPVEIVNSQLQEKKQTITAEDNSLTNETLAKEVKKNIKVAEEQTLSTSEKAKPIEEQDQTVATAEKITTNNKNRLLIESSKDANDQRPLQTSSLPFKTPSISIKSETYSSPKAFGKFAFFSPVTKPKRSLMTQPHSILCSV